MSRWTDEYENHAYKQSWNDLMQLVEDLTIDDETITTSMEELHRLQRVTEYLDGLLLSIDAELTPLSIWNTFHQQSEAARTQINNYNANRNIAHLHQANTHLDNLLTNIRPYMVLPKAVAASLKRSATIYSKTIKQKANNFLNEAKALLNEIKETKDSNDSLVNEIFNTNERITTLDDNLFDDGIEDKINELVESLERKESEVEEATKNILLNKDEIINYKNEIEESKQSILENQDEINQILENIESETKELKKFYIKSFGSEDDSGELIGGTKQKLEGLQETLKEFEEEQKIKYTALNNEIKTLLPGATSAGLATSFKSMKDSFKWPTRIASATFYVSLILLFFASLTTVTESVELWKISFVKIGDWQTILKGLTTKLPLYIPVIWVAYYSTKRRSEYKRLEQEYAHKETLAMSYQSFKKQIEEMATDNNELLLKLLDKSIESLAHNASETLDKKHGDKIPIQELSESLVEYVNKLKEKPIK